MESGDSVTASDGSNILFTVVSIIGEASGSLAGPEVSDLSAAQSATIGGAVVGTAK